jgi:hypothetical protein
MRKVLLVSGDSFTDPFNRSASHPLLDCSWPKWPELLAEKLDMDCINLGRSGTGNNYIYSSLRDFILKHPKKYNGKTYTPIHNDRIGLIIAGWSQGFRTDWQFGKYGRWRHERMPIKKDGDILGWLHESLNYYLDFQTLCNSESLKFMHVQMIPMYIEYIRGLPPTEQQIIYDGLDREKDSVSYSGDKAKVLKEIEKIYDDYDPLIDNCLFWKNESLNISLFGEWPNHYVISEADNHPNAGGHELIAQTLFKHYEKTYS